MRLTRLSSILVDRVLMAPSYVSNSSNGAGPARQFRRRDTDSSVGSAAARSATMGTNGTHHSTEELRDGAGPRRPRVRRLCTLWVQDDKFSREDVILNPTIFPPDAVKIGDLVEIAAVESTVAARDFQDVAPPPVDEMQLQEPSNALDGSIQAAIEAKAGDSARSVDVKWNIDDEGDEVDQQRRYLFLVKDLSHEHKSKQPNLQVSLTAHIANAFGFRNRMQVMVSVVDKQPNTASHVEISFRDEYLARSDMWRLAMSELSRKTIYRGQKLFFMGTIKAQIRHIYIRGRPVQSAYFAADTRPIFRSESARYVLLVQMSKEMWDFDADASGEIMFNRVTDGFLPELFQRWMRMGARHLVSIVLFTRVEYDGPPSTSLASALHLADRGPRHTPPRHNKPYRDFYRVVVSEMTNEDWIGILHQLKREFKIFRRDVSIQATARRPPTPAAPTSVDPRPGVPESLVLGQPSAALHGNLLEALNLAATQFVTDYIDRDLVRTGISIVVVTPGTGLFEVDQALLKITTEALMSNGIGVDLVCLNQMPLHSVPLFKYPRSPSTVTGGERAAYSGDTTPRQARSTYGSFTSNHGQTPSPLKGPLFAAGLAVPSDSSTGGWTYAIPHWIDISFWAPSGRHLRHVEGKDDLMSSNLADRGKSAGFVTRVKMYELQMMGIMENEMSNISVPYLHRHAFQPEPVEASTSLAPKQLRPAKIGSTQPSGQSTPKGPRLPPLDLVAPSSFAKVESHRIITKEDREVYKWTEVYDDNVFRPWSYLQAAARAARRERSEEDEKTRQADSLLFGTSFHDQARSPMGSLGRSGVAYFDRKMKERHVRNDPAAERKGSAGSVAKPADRPARVSRQLSFGLRLLGAAPPKAIASTEVKRENARPGPVLRQSVSAAHTFHGNSLGSTDDSSHSSRSSDAESDDSGASDKDRSPEKLEVMRRENMSTPIAIRGTALSFDGAMSSKAQPTLASVRGGYAQEKILSERMDVIQAASKTKQAGPKLDPSLLNPTLPPILAPTNLMAPWLTVVNPSNPSKSHVHPEAESGPWQHVFSHPMRAPSMKWKSLCSPAAVPLTTETFPSAEQFASEYQESPYTISQNEEAELSEVPIARDALFKELVALRLSQGFQLVIGEAVATAVGKASSKLVNLFDTSSMVAAGAMAVMSRGSAIHLLQCVEGGEVEVKRMVRKTLASTTGREKMGEDDEGRAYDPAIRTVMGESYEARQIMIQAPKEDYNWNYVDSFIAGYEEPYTEHLRFWRARFVLIPVEPSASARRQPHALSEDNEEETRLEGIRELTQMWQRYRFIPADERGHTGPRRQRRDANPLDIVYQTRDPSAVIAAELDGLPLVDTESSGRRSHLLTESERFQRSTLKLATLAQEIQGDQGIAMQDRRWHLRLHYNCFIGFEMTTWLLENFHDVETREDAVELGNELMREGLFQHVEGRHQFRDGNYFYQVASEYRAPRPESRRSWFGTRRSDRSVPSTPVSHPVDAFTSPRTDQTRSGSATTDDTRSEAGGATPGPAMTSRPTPTGGKKLKVALSKVMRYDVDHRKKSYRSELINLHYDRLHNPDNCYHIRIDWMNVTAKLIEDAIVSWATVAERFGLRLVEVPIAEASSITDRQPFRAPYLVRLARPPPSQRPQSFYDATSLAPQVDLDRHYYQKAMMKTFDFVLDIESARNFPATVEVTYSWGEPDYRYTQYIHRSGILLAQITDEGNFLLLANRLCNDRTAANADKFERAEGRETRSAHHSSPFSSPLVRAVPDARGPRTVEKMSSSDLMVRIRDELESFCSDPAGLQRFYDDVLSHAAPSGSEPQTPVLVTSIPALGLPPSMRDLSPSPLPSTAGPTSQTTGQSSPRSSMHENR
ncbi:MAG: vacuolar membrane-associated protein iml1 [Thelocarpon superellum]|nr:MAG: vacuolar membrane-associated protein iml1 [Thelocarpon superellum]